MDTEYRGVSCSLVLLYAGDSGAGVLGVRAWMDGWLGGSFGRVVEREELVRT